MKRKYQSSAIKLAQKTDHNTKQRKYVVHLEQDRFAPSCDYKQTTLQSAFNTIQISTAYHEALTYSAWDAPLRTLNPGLPAAYAIRRQDPIQLTGTSQSHFYTPICWGPMFYGMLGNKICTLEHLTTLNAKKIEAYTLYTTREALSTTLAYHSATATLLASQDNGLLLGIDPLKEQLKFECAVNNGYDIAVADNNRGNFYLIDSLESVVSSLDIRAKKINRLVKLTYTPSVAAFDGTQTLSIAVDNHIQLYDVRNADKAFKQFTFNRPVENLSLSPDKSKLAVSCEKELLVVSAQDGSLAAKKSYPNKTKAMHWLDNRTLFFSRNLASATIHSAVTLDKGQLLQVAADTEQYEKAVHSVQNPNNPLQIVTNNTLLFRWHIKKDSIESVKEKMTVDAPHNNQRQRYQVR